MQRLFFSDERILFLFAMYGFAVGVLLEIASLSEGRDILDIGALYYNYPTIVALLMVSDTLAGIEPVVQSMMSVLLSTGVWTLIAFVLYVFPKMFKIARRAEEGQRQVSE